MIFGQFKISTVFNDEIPTNYKIFELTYPKSLGSKIFQFKYKYLINHIIFTLSI